MQRSSDKETVSLDSRYQMAWTEVTARITQRQNALYLFMSISGIITAYFGSIKIDFSGNYLNVPHFWLKLIGLMGVPAVALAFARLNAKHDETIGLLRSFLKKCEAAGAAGQSETLKELSYNGNPYYIDPAKRYRKHHDTAFSWAIGLLCFAGLAIVAGDFFGAARDSGVVAIYLLYATLYVGVGVVAHKLVQKPPDHDV